ncbi:hypothetical protein DM860_014956 [Cuscuta australis]|uniref:Uncharacterized protein n=1 Tax=Cuscuta australis TaxID=267555 RepID=A0A328E683_9ASTE|nr:hypothetical protein DM860_014956 [Cuscuta australis]
MVSYFVSYGCKSERDTDSFKKRNHREQRGFEKQVASVATIPSSTTAKVVSHNGKGEQHKVSQAAPTNSASDAAVLQPQRCTRVRHSVTHQEINMILPEGIGEVQLFGQLDNILKVFRPILVAY